MSNTGLKTNTSLSRRDALKVISAGVVSGLSASCSSPALPAFNAFRFAVASDGHLGEANTPSNDYYRDLLSALQQQNQKTPLNFVVINGDLVHQDSPFLLSEAKAYLDQLPIPYYVTRGNHDRVSADQWNAMWGYPVNHSIELNEAGIILLDTSNERGEYLCGDAQWLHSALRNFPEDKPVFLFMHIPYYRDLSGNNLCNEILNTLNQFPMVRAVFHGHDHAKDMGLIIDGRAVMFDGHFGSSWGTDYRGFRVVEQTSENRYTSYQYDFVNQKKINELIF